MFKLTHLVFSVIVLMAMIAHGQDAPPTPEEIPTPQKSLLKSAATKDFNKPLFFDQIDNGLVLPPIELDYDLAQEGGKVLRMGNVNFSEKTFFFALQPVNKLHAKISQVVSSSEGNQHALVMSWPEKLMSHGTIEMISKTGEVMWTYNFTESDRKSWQAQIETWRKALLERGVPMKELKSGVFATQFGIKDLAEAKAPFWDQKESFRFCITQMEGRAQTKMCSQRYGSRTSGKNVVMGKIRAEPLEARALVQNENAPLTNVVPVGSEMPTSFYAELASGESYEFVALPNKMQLMDIADTQKPGILRVVGYDTRPIGNSVILNPDQYGSLTKLLGFEATIGDPRKFWATALKYDDAKLYFPGQGGGVFRQRFDLTEIPRRQGRVYLNRQTPTGTYIDGIELEGRKQPVSVVSSQQNSVTESKEDPARFTWNFRATERGKINRSYLEVEFEGKKYKSYFELYKGHPRELSGRFIAVHSAGEFVTLGELAYNQWFEDLFGWTNYWLSRQRWGFSGKVFQSLGGLKVGDDSERAPLSVMTLDLKYRFSPGLWGRDESVGALVSYQNVNFDELKAPMLGVGAFWARSMPKIFDDLFNITPFLRYPKWVDMEFIYYVNSMDSNVTLDSSMSLNFHGKVLWTDAFFGEAGFGIKRYAFKDASLNQQAELNTFYGTFGLGMNF